MRLTSLLLVAMLLHLASPAAAQSAPSSAEPDGSTSPRAARPSPEASTAPSRAELPPPDKLPEEPDQPRGRRIWYGLPIVVGDLVSQGFILGGWAGRVPELSYVGFAGHLLTGPMVHFAHGNVGRGFGSLGLNAGIATAGAVVGALIGRQVADGACVNEQTLGDAIGCPIGNVFTGIVAGASVGFLVAGVIDSAGIAYDRRTRSTVLVLPTMGPGNMGVRVAGAF